MSDLPTMWMPEHAIEGVRLLDRLKKQSRADFSSAPFGPGDVPFVPAARLDAANLENERLRGVLLAEPCRSCHGTGRYDPYCWYCNNSTHDHECPPSVACAHCTGTGRHFHAALTPKEP